MSIVARVSLLIPSHALPPFSYLIPSHLSGKIQVGTAVVVSLSGYSRLGLVIGFEEVDEDLRLKEIQSLLDGLSLSESMVKLCGWTARATALPLHSVLRMTLPPGLKIDTYEIKRPAPDWPWKRGTMVGRRQLRCEMGGDGLKAAERTGRVAFSPAPSEQRTVEWAVAEKEYYVVELRRAPRQRALMEALVVRANGLPVADLLSETGAKRSALRELVRRGAVRLERRPEPAPVLYTRGSGTELGGYTEEVRRGLLREGASLVWRMPSTESVKAAAAIAKAVVRRGKQTLVLAPEIAGVERLVEAFQRLLPAGLTVAPYHSACLGRGAVYEAARRGEVDVLVSTRTAALVPLAALGAVCVIDEPDEGYRASPGYEGIPIHIRELVRARGRIEGAAVFFLSPFPSLKLYAPESGARRLSTVENRRWPAVSVVDMRGSGGLVSRTLLDACRQTIHSEERVGVVARLGSATSVYCNRCGFVPKCSLCDLPLILHGTLSDAGSFFFCRRCDYKETASEGCRRCDSVRLSVVGLTANRVQTELANALDADIGLLTADKQERGGALVVVGTARCITDREWDLIAIPDVDSFLFFADSVEKGFRLVYRAAEMGRRRLLVQTRFPNHHTLRTALQGDYEAFAAEELPKRRALLYPPHAHLAEFAFEGPEEAVRRAVESRLRPTLKDGIKVLESVPHSPSEGQPVWRVLLRSPRRDALAESAAFIARLAAEDRGRNGLKVHINMDPEEV